MKKMNSLAEAKKKISRREHELRLKKAECDFHKFDNLEDRAKKLNVTTGQLIQFCLMNHVLIRENKKTGMQEYDKTALDFYLGNSVLVQYLGKTVNLR